MHIPHDRADRLPPARCPGGDVRWVDGGDAESTRRSGQFHGLLALRMLDEGMAVAPPGTPAKVCVESRVFSAQSRP